MRRGSAVVIDYQELEAACREAGSRVAPFLSLTLNDVPFSILPLADTHAAIIVAVFDTRRGGETPRLNVLKAPMGEEGMVTSSRRHSPSPDAP